MHIPTHTYRETETQRHTIRSPPLASPTPAVPTQIITLPIIETATIEDSASSDGKTWDQALDILQSWNGFRSLYWGRHVEEAWKVQVLVARETLNQHYAFLSSPQWKTLTTTLLAPLYPPPQSQSSPTPTPSPEPNPEKEISVYHSALQDFTTNAATLSSAPVTGTAVYLTTSAPGWEKTWALWTTLVPSVKGCLGCTGGWISEPVEGHEAYVVYVGWESIQDHDNYHHTKDFARKRVILGLHNTGWRGYGHVRFIGVREVKEGESEGGKREGKL